MSKSTLPRLKALRDEMGKAAYKMVASKSKMLF